MNTKYFKDIKKQILSESVLSHPIKFMYFTSRQINKFKDQKNIVVVRNLTDTKDIIVGDFIKPQWGTIYQVEDTQIINDITQYKDYALLQADVLAEIIGDYKQLYKVIKLKKYEKKNIRRFFYDCEFDETEFGIKLISIGIVDENGNELYIINKDYNWDCSTQWLYDNVYPYVKNAPDYIKIPYNKIKEKIIEFIQPSLLDDIKLYGYYSDYDHVVLCQIFGKMIDLPKGMPMYTNDLKQIIDYFGININKLMKEQQLNEHQAISDAKWNLKIYNAIKTLLNVKI